MCLCVFVRAETRWCETTCLCECVFVSFYPCEDLVESLWKSFLKAACFEGWRRRWRWRWRSHTHTQIRGVCVNYVTSFSLNTHTLLVWKQSSPPLLVPKHGVAMATEQLAVRPHACVRVHVRVCVFMYACAVENSRGVVLCE